MDEKSFLTTRRPIHQSKPLALSFSLHFQFFAAELIGVVLSQTLKLSLVAHDVLRRLLLPAAVAGWQHSSSVCPRVSAAVRLLQPAGR